MENKESCIEEVRNEQVGKGGAKAKKTFSVIGFAMFAVIIVVDLLQAMLYMFTTGVFGEEITGTPVYNLAQMGILYFIGLPAGVVILSRLPKTVIPKKKLGVKEMFVYFLISISFMYIGNISIRVLMKGLELLGGVQFLNPVDSFLTENSLPVTVILTLIMAPLTEEFLCRKLIIDRVIQYGEWVAIFTSAVLFGLFHRNLFQFIYAYLVGLILGYIYVKTGRLRYPIVLHMILNFFGGVFALIIGRLVGEEALENYLDMEFSDLEPLQRLGMVLAQFYSAILILSTIAGVILYIRMRRKITLSEGEILLSKRERMKIIFLNPGMLALVVLCVVTTIAILFSFS